MEKDKRRMLRETMCRGSPESFTITPIERKDMIIRKHEYISNTKQHDHHMQHVCAICRIPYDVALMPP
jgi:hypothetical protein